MAYDPTLPLNDGYLADAPAELRELFRALKEDKIVNAGKLNGYTQGNANGNIPLNNGTLNTNLNADMLDGHDSAYFSASTHGHDAATTSAAGFMTATQVTKLNGIATGAEVNQNAFSNVTVGSSTIQADGKTDTLTLAAGNAITLTADTTNDKVTIAVTSNTFLPLAGGTMTGSIVSNSGGYVIRGKTNDLQVSFLAGSSGNAIYGAKMLLNGADYTDSGWFTLQAGNSTGYKQLIGKPDGSLTWNGASLVHAEATSSKAGLMSATDKATLNSLADWSLTNSAGQAAGSLIYNPSIAMKGINSAGTLTLIAANSSNATLGAKAYLYGADANNSGNFVLQAGNSTGYKQLIGKPDGSLTWNGASITNENVMYTTGGSCSGSYTNERNYAGWWVKHPSYTPSFGVYVSGQNRGLYDTGINGWILAVNSSGVLSLASTIYQQLAPTPKTSSGVGQVVNWGGDYSDALSSYTLPSGGTWLCITNSRSKSNDPGGICWLGLRAGGTKITPWSNCYTQGIAWRIA